MMTVHPCAERDCGALLDGEYREMPGYRVRVGDTVGAGRSERSPFCETARLTMRQAPTPAKTALSFLEFWHNGV
jgi:hypothetical protein